MKKMLGKMYFSKFSLISMQRLLSWNAKSLLYLRNFSLCTYTARHCHKYEKAKVSSACSPVGKTDISGPQVTPNEQKDQ